jgi:hypothetical protein
MSDIGTEFLPTQADLYVFSDAANLSPIDVDPSREFLASRIHQTNAKKILSIGSGNGMHELGCARYFPDTRFTLVEPSCLQHDSFRQVVTKCEIEQSRFELVAKPFAEYFTEQKFDLLYSRHAWYYAHSASELHRAMESLRAGGEFLITMWCEGSAIWRQCRDLGAAGRSPLGHLLSAEEVIGCAHRLGYAVHVDFHGGAWLTRRRAQALSLIVEQTWNDTSEPRKVVQECLGSLLRDDKLQKRFWESPLGEGTLAWLAYIVGIPKEQLGDEDKAKALRWEFENVDAHGRYAEMIISGTILGSANV